MDLVTGCLFVDCFDQLTYEQKTRTAIDLVNVVSTLYTMTSSYCGSMIYNQSLPDDQHSPRYGSPPPSTCTGIADNNLWSDPSVTLLSWSCHRQFLHHLAALFTRSVVSSRPWHTTPPSPARGQKAVGNIRHSPASILHARCPSVSQIRFRSDFFCHHNILSTWNHIHINFVTSPKNEDSIL